MCAGWGRCKEKPPGHHVDEVLEVKGESMAASETLAATDHPPAKNQPKTFDFKSDIEMDKLDRGPYLKGRRRGKTS